MSDAKIFDVAKGLKEFIRKEIEVDDSLNWFVDKIVS